jgi:chorismate synthase
MLRVLTSGESHGTALTAIVDGLPAGMPVSVQAIDAQLARRQGGYGRGKRQQIEHDRVEIASGVRFGRTLPGPVTLVVRNKDYENWRTRMSPEPQAETCTRITRPRPGHADFAGALKYEIDDIRDILERSSARTTAALVAAGALCRSLLDTISVQIMSHVCAIGAVHAPTVEVSALKQLYEAIEASAVRCADESATKAMVAAIDAATEAGDTLGGVFEVVAIGCPPGLGTPAQWDRRLDARLAAALMSIQAVKGVEIGAGFEGAQRLGSEVHDAIARDPEKGYVRRGNNAGGIEGGISNGEPIVIRCAVKPLPTLRKRLTSVDMATQEEAPAHFERSDVCSVPAAGVIGEAMMAIILADAALERFGGDSLGAFLRNWEATKAQLADRGYTGVRWSKS